MHDACNGNEVDRGETVYKQTRRRPRLYTSALGAEVHAIVGQQGGRPVIRGLARRLSGHHFPGSYWQSQLFHSAPHSAIPVRHRHRHRHRTTFSTRNFVR